MFSEFYTAELDPVTRTSWTAKSTANSPINRLSGPNPHPIIGVGNEASSALSYIHVVMAECFSALINVKKPSHVLYSISYNKHCLNVGN